MTDWYFAGFERKPFPVAGAAVAHSAAYTAFIARTSGLDATHLNAYAALLDGMTTDGLFNSDGTSNFFDAFYIFATQDSTTALLNIVGNIFNASLVSAPSFTADSGFLGDGSNYIDTGMNPFTASSPKFARDSAHWSHWNLTNSTANQLYSGVSNTEISMQFFSSDMYPRVNDSDGPTASAVTDPRGHIVGTRGSATARKCYINGSLFDTNAASNSVAVVSNNFYVLWDGAAAGAKSATRTAAYSIGADLGTGSDASNFYSRLRAYMTAVGVP